MKRTKEEAKILEVARKIRATGAFYSRPDVGPQMFGQYVEVPLELGDQPRFCVMSATYAMESEYKDDPNKACLDLHKCHRDRDFDLGSFLAYRAGIRNVFAIRSLEEHELQDYALNEDAGFKQVAFSVASHIMYHLSDEQEMSPSEIADALEELVNSKKYRLINEDDLKSEGERGGAVYISYW